MFNTLKSKIIVITLSMLMALIIVMSYFSFIYLKNSKFLLTESCSHTVSLYGQKLNNYILRIEDNVEDLSFTGLIYYTGKNYDIAKKFITNTFNNDFEGSIGGGIWFEPYVINPKEKRFCVYVYKNKNNEIVLDKSNFDYQKRIWYRQLKEKIKDDQKIVWSTPYYDIQDNKTLVVTAGTGIFDDKNNFLGFSSVDCKISEIAKYVEEMKPTPGSFALLANKKNNCIIASTDKYLDNENLIGKSLDYIPWFAETFLHENYFTYHGVKYISYIENLPNGTFLIVNVPEKELFYSEFVKVFVLFIALILMSAFISFLLYILLKKNIIQPINKLTSIATKISRGEQNIKITIEKPEEFAHLASTFDEMTKNIKFMAAEKEKLISELTIAKSIQASSLPDVEKLYGNCEKFDIYASMQPARDVGGDFYDCYFIDDDNFMFLIADVSGKGIPAALFMMTVKTLIKNSVQSGISWETLIKNINKNICENNKHGFFVTVFIGILNVKTGKLTCINCGHNKPLFKTNQSDYKYLDFDSNIVLGAFDEFDFKLYEEQLKDGDIIFTYTDGITEALNDKEELFGEERLSELLNKSNEDNIKLLINKIKTGLSEYVQNVPQSDDITMLALKYKDSKIRTFNESAVKENYKKFYGWLHDICQEWNINDDLANKIDMCGEEIYANVIFYSYPEKAGEIKVTVSENDNKLILKFEDEGIPYNPLERKNPDITLPPEERPLGGLGIFMVKEMADDVKYVYENNKNILTLEFIL